MHPLRTTRNFNGSSNERFPNNQCIDYVFQKSQSQLFVMKHAVVVLVFAFVSVRAQKNMKIISQWKDIDYAFPSPLHRQQAIQNGLYITGRGVPLDMDVDYRDQGRSRIIVTLPRGRTGIPITLGFITFSDPIEGAIIKPYPNYESQSSHGQNCSNITSVFRVAVSQSFF